MYVATQLVYVVSIGIVQVIEVGSSGWKSPLVWAWDCYVSIYEVGAQRLSILVYSSAHVGGYEICNM